MNNLTESLNQSSHNHIPAYSHGFTTDHPEDTPPPGPPQPTTHQRCTRPDMNIRYEQFGERNWMAAPGTYSIHGRFVNIHPTPTRRTYSIFSTTPFRFQIRMFSCIFYFRRFRVYFLCGRFFLRMEMLFSFSVVSIRFDLLIIYQK